MVVYNAHLESRSTGPIQAAQIDEMLADLKQYPAGTAAILGGDLNTKYFPSIYSSTSWSAGFHSATGERIERTHTIAMALDWLFARGPIKLDSGAVRRDIKGSDHYPVYARLTVAVNLCGSDPVDVLEHVRDIRLYAGSHARRAHLSSARCGPDFPSGIRHNRSIESTSAIRP